MLAFGGDPIGDPGEHLDDLGRFGWDEAWASAYASRSALGREPARVVAEDRGSYLLAGPRGELRGSVSGRFRFDADEDPARFPAVGDWVVVDGALLGDTVIHDVLPRRSSLMRQAAGRRTETQIVAANLDVVFIVASLNAELNVRRLERYLAAAWESRAEPVVLLTKVDLSPDADIDDALVVIGAVAAGAAVIPVSAFDGRGMAAVRDRLGAGRTVAFVGSSGVGKSTLLNALAGDDIAETRAVRDDDSRGRHTTTRRQLHLLPDGCLVVDTPGMRELALWDGDGLEGSFADIVALGRGCRFRDCGHDGEPDCAIAAALTDGRLEIARYESWRKLQREAAHHERRVDALARTAERRRWRQIGKAVTRHMDAKYGAEGWR
jgi:ribosome biogenesis GTPase / thiamine phosphate phosphatase